MATFDLVHGAWHRADCWNYLRDALEARGHVVRTMTFRGCGERFNPKEHPRPGLGEHCEDLATFAAGGIRTERPRVLVLHSYAGTVFSSIAPVIRDQYDEIVFLDAIIPVGTQRLKDMLTVQKPLPDWLKPWSNRIQWQVLLSRPVPPPPVQFMGITNANRAAWVASLMTPMFLPLRYGFEKLTTPHLDNATYIHCTNGPSIITTTMGKSAKYARLSGWNYLEIAAGHDAMVDEPEMLADMLVALVPAVVQGEVHS